MRYDAVLFDLDGTLTASAPGITASVQHALSTMGEMALDEATLMRFVGPPLFDSFQRYAGMSPEEADRAVAIYREHYTQNGLFNAHVYTGIPNLLRQLKAAGVYVALATAKPLPSALRVIEHFGLKHFFDVCIGADFARKEESKVSILRDALPANFQKAAMVGDRHYDIEAAKTLGLDGFGALWGYGTRDELLTAGADEVVESPSDLLPLLLSETEQPRGFFITLEGLDGCGKTTQMERLTTTIRQYGYEVVATHEPGGTPTAEAIRELVLDPSRTVCAETEALLYAASRAQHVRERIRPALARGAVVLCDRYVDSSIVYQGAGRELGMDDVRLINDLAVGDTLPDCTLLFMIDARTSLLRRQRATDLDRLERAGEAFFLRVCAAYARLLADEPQRIIPIDASRTPELVFQDASAYVHRLLTSR